MKPRLKSRLQAVLFASSQPLTVEQLCKMIREQDEDAVRHSLLEIADELEQEESSLMLVEDNGSYRLTVREKYLPYVKKVARQTELPKSLTETLAVVSYKAPVKQSEVIRIRHNKGYKHLDELEKLGFISRERKGRTKLIKLTQKFYDYFDLTPEQLKKRFENVAQLEQEMGVEVYDRTETYDGSSVETYSEKLDGLEVYELPSAPGLSPKLQPYGEAVPEEREMPEPPEREAEIPIEEQEKKPVEEVPADVKEPGLTAESIAEEARQASAQVKKKESKGLWAEGVPEEVEKKVDERVEELLSGGKEEEGQ